MTQRYLGGIITANPVEPSSNLSTASASGMWTLQEALSFYRAGDWPDATNTPSVGLIKGGYAASAPTDTVNKIIPETAGNATDFGNLSASNYSLGALSSDTRSVAAGGYYNNSAYTDIIEYFTFASAGNATDFGDASAVIFNTTGISNNVRGVFALGNAGGSGVVIIRTPKAFSLTTGSPTITTDGSFTVYTFTGSGSITV